LINEGIIDHEFIFSTILGKREGLPLNFYPVRKPQYLCWGGWEYLQKQGHQLLIEGGVKALSFLTGFTFFPTLTIGFLIIKLGFKVF
jgi:hypothetical protein